MMRVKRIAATALLAVMIMSILSFPASGENDVISVGASYTVAPESPVENAFPNLANKDDGKSLTDGKKGANESSDKSYIHFYRGTYYCATIDLGAEMAVSGVNVGQFQVVGAGIHFSRRIYMYVSSDGENFTEVGSYENDNIIRDGGNTRKEFEVKADATYKARYVRVRFSSDVYCYVDEISVLGSKDVPADAKNPENPYKVENVGFKGAVDGINHICLIYTGEYYMDNTSNIGKVTQEQFTPYLCYVDNSGKPTDMMFEGLLFLPLQPISSSENANMPHSFGKKTGWEAYLDATIGKTGTEICNLAALNAEVAAKRDTLGLDKDYKYPVYIAVPYVEPSNIVFGEINGENVTPSSVEARNTIVDWYVDLVIEKFNNAGFDNLKLNGFYWYSETILYKHGDSDIQTIKHFNEYAQNKGYSTTWIPYYCAPGFERAVELGFSAAVLQTGHAFKRAENSETGDSKPASCDDAAAQAEKHGLGIEVEVSGLDEDGYKRYYKYLQASYAAGHMEDGLFMYYQNGGPGAYYSASKAAAGSLPRRAYDITYQFIKGTFSSQAPTLADGYTIVVKKDSKTSGTLPIIDKDSAKGELSVINASKPESFKMLLEGSGFFVINTKDSDFVGDAEISFNITDGFNTSDKVTVKIKVVEDCLVIDSENRTMRDNFAVVYDTGSSTQTADGAYEVVVENGVVTKVGGNNNAIPKNGYVIAATGSKKDYLEANATVGNTVLYDSITQNVAFVGEKKPTESSSNDPAPSSNPYIPLIIAGCAAVGLAAAAIFAVFKSKKKK